MDEVSLRQRLERALRSARQQGDSRAVSAFRSALGALDNAGAVTTSRGPRPAPTATVAGASHGVGSTEVPRRILSEERQRQLVRTEVEARRAAARDYRRWEQEAAAADLTAEADALAAVLDAGSAPRTCRDAGADG